MKLPRRQVLHLAAGAIAVPAVSGIARAQTYPTRPITMIVGAPAGGPTDIVARIMAEPMRASLGQPVIIENITGAGGALAAGRVARAAPDGYTLEVGNFNTHVANGAVYALQYDIVKDFEPVALLSSSPMWIVTRMGELEGIDCVAQSQSRQGIGRSRWCWHRSTSLRRLLPTKHRYSFSVRALSRWCPGYSGFGRRTDRPDVRRGIGVRALRAQRKHQSPRGHGEGPLVRRTRHSNRRRSRSSGTLLFLLARPVGPQGHSEGNHRHGPLSRRLLPIRGFVSGSSTSVRKFRRVISKPRRC